MAWWENNTPLTAEQQALADKYRYLAVCFARRNRWAVDRLGLDDAISEAYLGLVRGVRSWKEGREAGIKHYLYCSIKRTLFLAVMKDGIAKRKVSSRGQYSDPVRVLSFQEMICENGESWQPIDNAEESIYTEEIHEHLQSGLKLLRSRDRAVVTRWFAGETLEEIARSYGVTRQALHPCKERALSILRSHFFGG